MAVARISVGLNSGNFIPYIGADSAVNLGSNTFSVQGNSNLGNASSTNQKIVRIGQGTSFVDIGEISGAFPGIWFQQSNPGPTNYTMGGDANDVLFNAASSYQLRFSNVARVGVVDQSVGTNSQDFFSMSPPTYTAFSTIEHRTFRIQARTRTWPAGGTVALNRENLIEATTYTSASVVNMTNVYGLFVNAGVAAGSVSIANNWAIGSNGSLAILNNGILKLGNAATTGLIAGALAATTNASIVIYDSTGQAYRIPCII